MIGLHTVFEHHAAQGTPAALEAFLHEYRIGFPVGLDVSSGPGRLPKAMDMYQMQGTPTTLLFDKAGRLRVQKFGHLDDLRLGASIAALMAEGHAPDTVFAQGNAAPSNAPGVCKP